MYRIFFKSLAIALLVSAASFAQSGQSLGDIARENREKQASQEASGVTPRVITNKDLPAGSQMPEANLSEPMTQVSGVSRPSGGRSYDRLADQNYGGQRASEQWRGRIQEQESKVADLQARIDQMNASMRNGAQFEAPYNRNQARQMQRLAQMQDMLDQQKRRLYMMQEAARRAGMHTTVYDP